MAPSLVAAHAQYSYLNGDKALGHRTRAIFGNNTVNGSSLYTVNDIIACAGHEMAISEDLYIVLDTSQHGSLPRIDNYKYVPCSQILHATSHIDPPCHRP